MTSVTHYDSAMLRGPGTAPVIGRMGGGTIASFTDSQPFRVVGANAVVYQLRQPNGKVEALRCWLADEVSPEVIGRYRALSDQVVIRSLHASRHSPIVNTISLHADGVLIEGEDGRRAGRPVVVLDWLMGPTVMAAVDRACKASDRGYLEALATSWTTAVMAASEVGFIHGDLSADNAIVRPKEGIAYVDYDTAWWPAAPSVPALDPAVAYRHAKGVPARIEQADDFAALVMYVSLRVLAAWPELRAQHGQPATVKGAGLLFQPRDLANPDGSPLFGKLRVLNDTEVLGLLSILRAACLADVDDVPTYAEALELAGNVATSHPLGSPSGGRVTSLLSSAASAVKGTANRGTDRLRQIARPTAEDSWPEPQRNWRPERLAGLGEAIRAQDLERAEELWADVKGEPGAGALVPALEKLRAGHRVAPPESPEGRRVARDQRRRDAAQRRFANALDHGDRAVLVDMALSGELDDVEGLTEASTLRVVGSLAISHLERALETDDDNLIIDAYDAQILNDQGLLTQEQRNRVDLAFDRRAWLDDVRRAVRSQDLAALDRLFAAVPDGAETHLRERERIRIERLRTQDRAVQNLRAAVREQRYSDVLSALGTVERLGAAVPEDLSWPDVSHAIDRYSLILAIRTAAEQVPRDIDRLGRLLPQLREANGGSYPSDSADFDALELEVTQFAQLSRIREALAEDNDRKIVTVAFPDFYRVVPQLDRGEQARIERAMAAASRALRRSGQRTSSASSSETVSTT
jgi:hypothetical protein